MFASVALVAGLVLLVVAGVLLAAVIRVRRRIREAAWVLTRAAAALGEAERAGRIRAELAEN